MPSLYSFAPWLFRSLFSVLLSWLLAFASSQATTRSHFNARFHQFSDIGAVVKTCTSLREIIKHIISSFQSKESTDSWSSHAVAAVAAAASGILGGAVTVAACEKSLNCKDPKTFRDENEEDDGRTRRKGSNDCVCQASY